MYGYIYKTTNKVNNKIYIGQKKSDKFLNEKYLGSGARLKSAIKHYGKNNFTVDLLQECFSEEELNEREIYFIQKYDSQNPDIGYNLQAGGDSKSGFTWTQEQKDNLSKVRQGHLVSYETKLKISQSNKGKGGKCRENYHHTKMTRAKISESNKASMTDERKEKHRLGVLGEKNGQYGKPAVNRKSVICLDDNKIFPTVTEASIYYGVRQSSVTLCCQGKCKTTGGLHFRFA